MLKTTIRLNLILMMNNHNLMLALLKVFDAEKILSCCGILDEREVKPTSYIGCEATQRELIGDERFAGYLRKMISAGIAKEVINAFLADLHSRDEAALDYPVGRLISSMMMTLYKREVFYDYLKYFSCLPSDKERKKLIVNNLALYRRKESTPVAQLPDIEREFLTEPYIYETDLIPNDSVNKAITMITQNSGLTDILRFFNENEICVSLEMTHYEHFILEPGAILEKLKTLYKMLGKDNEKMENLVTQWLGNNCPIFDLQVLNDKLGGLDDEQTQAVLDARSGYINFIYGGRISSIPLSEVPSYKEDILIYAITNKKNSFIRLIEENYQLFSDLKPDSVLLRREFYDRYVNLNSLNAKNLKECGQMNAKDMAFDALVSDRSYTFEEIKALYSYPAQYIKLYNKLDNLRVDTRLIVIKQLTKQRLLDPVTDDAHIDRLAEAFTVKPLSVWKEQDFLHIAGLKPQDAVELLIYRTETGIFIPQMKTRTDARLVLRNLSSAQSYNTVDEMKGDIVKIDSAWRELVHSMGLNKQFLKQNQERVIEFLCQNGAYIAKTYYDNLNDDMRKEALKRIVKAELMGEFNTLKYFADDLRKEINYPISKPQKESWTENSEMTRGNITVRECDDFYGTMLMGTAPQRTCLSYIDGQYKECLLSNFDSNKKILYAYVNGKIAGRAIIRLTKSRFSIDAKSEVGDASFSFVDLENLKKTAETQEAGNNGENLTLFLERYYTAAVSPETEKQIVNMFIELMENKAEQMGVMLVLSNSYSESGRSGYARTLLHIYISRSKAGSQYLDSLNGSASVSDEGGYKSNNFFIRKDDILTGGIENA